MNTLEDKLREALAERATLSPIDPDAWDKTQARGRRRLRWFRPARTGLLVPAAAAAAVAAAAIAASTLAGHVGSGGSMGRGPAAKPSRSAISSTSPSVPAPPGKNDPRVREIPPVTPFVPIKMFADRHWVSDFLWFGYLPGNADAGLALCQVNRGGFYDGFSACGRGSLPAGALARSTGTDGSGWIRLGITAAQVTSISAVQQDGHTVHGVVDPVPGLPYKVWAVSYPVDPSARLVFSDAAGHEVTHLDMPGSPPTPSRPDHGGIPLFRYGSDMMTAYRISGGQIGFWWGADTIVSDIPAGEPALRVMETVSIRGSSGGLTPADWFGYAPAGTARVVLRLADGRQFSSATVPGWPGSGVVFWGPLTLPHRISMPDDIMVITYDAAGHILHKVPLIFIG
jgi:hypothetical protein